MSTKWLKKLIHAAYFFTEELNISVGVRLLLLVVSGHFLIHVWLMNLLTVRQIV